MCVILFCGSEICEWITQIASTIRSHSSREERRYCSADNVAPGNFSMQDHPKKKVHRDQRNHFLHDRVKKS